MFFFMFFLCFFMFFYVFFMFFICFFYVFFMLDLGRINYLLTDKTGTLTRNEMIFRKIHIGLYIFI
jgi:hypothetical protein